MYPRVVCACDSLAPEILTYEPFTLLNGNVYTTVPLMLSMLRIVGYCVLQVENPQVAPVSARPVERPAGHQRRSGGLRGGAADQRYKTLVEFSDQ